MKETETKKKKKINIYFSASSKVETGGGPSGTASMLNWRRPNGRIYSRTIRAGHPLLTAPQAQLTAAIEALQCLKLEGLDITLIGTSADVAGWVSGKYKFGPKTKNRGLVRQLLSLLAKHEVRFIKAEAEHRFFVHAKEAASEEASIQWHKSRSRQASRAGLALSNQPQGGQYALFT